MFAHKSKRNERTGRELKAKKDPIPRFQGKTSRNEVMLEFELFRSACLSDIFVMYSNAFKSFLTHYRMISANALRNLRSCVFYSCTSTNSPTNVMSHGRPRPQYPGRVHGVPPRSDGDQ